MRRLKSNFNNKVMKKIKIVNKIIELNLINEESFQTLNKYESEGDSDYYITSRVGTIDLSGGKIINQTEYYDTVLYNDYNVQLQRDGNDYIGAIIYKQNTIELIMFANDFNLEYLLSQYAFLYILNQMKNTMFIHGSSIFVNNKGILFCAKSGTGKSTHRKLWERLGNAICINDDKNVVVEENNELWLYPNPWSGKHQIDNNIKAKLGAIVFLYQNKENVVSKIKPIEGLRLLLGQVSQPGSDNLDNWNKMIDEIILVPMYRYGCNMADEAYSVLNKRLGEDNIWE